MRHILPPLFLAILLTSNLVAQEVTSSHTAYYKDSNRSKPCEEKKAKTKTTEIHYDDGTYVYEVYDLKKGEHLKLSRTYKDGSPTGIWATYNLDGTLASKHDFSKLVYATDSIAGGAYFNLNKLDSLDFEPPSFKGGDEAWYDFLGTSTHYPNIAKEMGIQGRVFIHVKIDAEGKLYPLSIFRGVSPYLDIETWRVLELSPNWAPATKDGEAIDSYTLVPFDFRLQ